MKLRRLFVIGALFTMVAAGLPVVNANAAAPKDPWIPLHHVRQNYPIALSNRGCSFLYQYGTFGPGYAQMRLTSNASSWGCIGTFWVEAVYPNGRLVNGPGVQFGGSAPTYWYQSKMSGATAIGMRIVTTSANQFNGAYTMYVKVSAF